MGSIKHKPQRGILCTLLQSSKIRGLLLDQLMKIIWLIWFLKCTSQVNYPSWIQSSKMIALLKKPVLNIPSLDNMTDKSLIGSCNMAKERAQFFFQVKQDLLLEGYDEFKT